MQTVILSAGRSTRFSSAGYTGQKSMLPMGDGRVLLDWQIERLQPETLLYVSRKEYQKAEWPKLQAIMYRSSPIHKFMHHWIDTATQGPLDGLWQVRNWLATDESLLISYNDELVEQHALLSFLKTMHDFKAPAGVVCFDNPDDRFSRIPGTNLACGCTYWFENGYDFVKKLRSAKRGKENGVPDIVYKYKDYKAYELQADDYVELGTAKEYELWMAS